MSQPTPKKRFGFRIDEELLSKFEEVMAQRQQMLEAAGQAKELTRSALMRDILTSWIKTHERNQQEWEVICTLMKQIESQGNHPDVEEPSPTSLEDVGLTPAQVTGLPTLPLPWDEIRPGDEVNQK